MSPALEGKRILIVEDEYWIASDLARAFKQEDAVVVGPVGSVAAGMALMETEAVDAAVLDINLMGARSYPLADRLTDDAVPHIFVSGYDSWSLPKPYQQTQCVPKPFAASHVVSAVEQFFEKPTS